MGIRLNKSIRLGKHVRLNISKSGIGFSLGIMGLRLGVGPRGTRFTADLPGSGIYYVKQWSGKSSPKRAKAAAPDTETAAPPSLPRPGLFAPAHEKALVHGLEASQAQQPETALQHFLAAAPQEPAAAILAAALLAARGDYAPAIPLLEEVVQREEAFPTPLMEKYEPLIGMLLVQVTPSVAVEVPVDGLGAALLLAELYQAEGQLEEAIDLLDQLSGLVENPVLTLSLCELYGHYGLWESVIERASGIEATDDVSLATAIWYGRAMQAQGLHEAALSVFTAALRRKKDRSPDLLREGTYWRALTYQALGKRAQANKALQQVYAEDPHFRDVAQRVGL